ncbi:MAG: hypothetical protein WAW92_04440 [Minisyncoccia bacterium]
MGTQKRQKFLIFILFILLIGAGVYFYDSQRGEIIQTVTDIVTEGIPEPVGEDILVLVQRLDYTSIDDSIFTSSMFTNLIDTSLVINTEEKSKPNPFASFVANTISSTKR